MLAWLLAAAWVGEQKSWAQAWPSVAPQAAMPGWPPGWPAAAGMGLGGVGDVAEAWRQAWAKVPDDIRWASVAAGIQAYLHQPAPPARDAGLVLARAGGAALREVGQDHGLAAAPAGAKSRKSKAGKSIGTVVLVPSLVNRGYVLDLHPRHSLVEALRFAGLRVLVMDWGVPDPANPRSLDTVVADQLVPLLQAAAAHGPVTVFGYCMGGLLALAGVCLLQAQGQGQMVQGLSLAAMPWDFAATPSQIHAAWAKSLWAPWEQLGAGGTMPTVAPELLAQYFWALDPWGPVRRLMAFATTTDPARLAHMTALEDWLGDGLPLDGPVAQMMMRDWYGANATLNGTWQVAGVPVRPREVNVPLQVIVTQRDTLVPLASALPFVGQTRGASVVMADTGHVGLVCGRRAEAALYRPLVEFVTN